MTVPEAGRRPRRALAGARALLALVALTLSACVTTAPPVRAARPPAAAPAPRATGGIAHGEVAPPDVAGAATGAAAALAGAWEGRWGRGTVALRLGDASGGAPGELLLSVPPREDVFTTPARGAAGRTTVRVPLARVVRDGAALRLETERYWDPGCGCTVRGTLRGTVRGDTLVGVYALDGAATVGSQRGRWRAVRQVPSAEGRTAASDRPRP